MNGGKKKVLLTICRVLFGIGALGSGGLAIASAGDPEVLPVSLFFASVCALGLWFAFRGHIAMHRRMILFGILAGIVFGSIALFGEMSWACNRWPESNLAPMWGIICAGPVGFMLGAVIGIVLGILCATRKG